MPVMDGVEATRRLTQTVPTARVIVLTMFDENEEIFEALRAGSLGYLLKACSAEKPCKAVRAAAKGTSVLEPRVAAKMMAELMRLSARRQKDSQPFAEPLSARELGITGGTVKNHITNVLGKLGVLDRTHAALRPTNSACSKQAGFSRTPTAPPPCGGSGCPQPPWVPALLHLGRRARPNSQPSPTRPPPHRRSRLSIRATS